MATNAANLHLDAESQTTHIQTIDEPPTYKESCFIIDNSFQNSRYMESSFSLSNPPTYDSIESDTNAKHV